MDIITLDWESYYDPASKYSLSSMTTEDYVTDPRFEEILVSGKRNGGRTDWFSGSRSELGEWLGQWDLPNNALLAQNTRFDGLILAVHYGIIPKFYLDTLAMARPSLKPVIGRLGLKYLCDHFGLPPKGDEVVRAMGKRRADFTDWELREYARYCCNDTDQTYELFGILRDRLSRDDLQFIDMTLRMYLEPELRLHAPVYRESLAEVRARKAKTFAELEVQGITKKALSSGVQFAQLLRDRGVEPPMKPSPASLKRGDDPPEMTYAFGKSDPEFIELIEEFAEDPEMSAIFAARTEAKSTIEEKRCETYLAIAERYDAFRVPLVPFGAHTLRYTGDEGLNVLNLSNPGKYKDKVTGETKYKSKLRFGVRAREADHCIVAADLSQIECRITAALAGQDDLLQAFAIGADIYSEFATDMFGRPVSKELADKDPQADKDRKCGKATILGAGFGMGPPKFRRAVRSQGLKLTEEESERFIGFYRTRYPTIPTLWGTYDQAIQALAITREEQWVGPLRFHWLDDTTAAIDTADQRRLLYPNLKAVRKKNRLKIICRHANDKWDRNLWGGVITENAAQALAAIVIKRIMLDIFRETGYRTKLQIYDEVLFAVHKSEVEDFLKAIKPIMSQRVDFLPNCPIAFEAKAGESYGDV